MSSLATNSMTKTFYWNNVIDKRDMVIGAINNILHILIILFFKDW
jgi:hypothetical protein